MSDLLNCPMCGSPPVIDGRSDDVRIRCWNCGVTGPVKSFDSENQTEMDAAEESAIAAWNRRHAGAATPVAFLHSVASDDGELDHALSFTADSFPLEGVAGYRKISVQPLYTAAAVPGDCVVAEHCASGCVYWKFGAPTYRADAMYGPLIPPEHVAVPRELFQELRDIAQEEADEYRRTSHGLRPQRQAYMDSIVTKCDELKSKAMLDAAGDDNG